jgi:hypothetical protein
MNIDLLPFSAFALESYGTSAPSRSDSYTLTLELTLATVQSSREVMSGNAKVGEASSEVRPLRAAVLSAEGSALTITF